jgi:hypothetical protein
MTNNERRARCSFEGCWRTSAQPYTDGWVNLSGWGVGIKDGFYCRPHADAIEATGGELKYIQNGGA